jgi:predicted DNA-binding transcriptional regulator YafY
LVAGFNIFEKKTYLMNRIDRLTAILVQLQSKRVVKAQEIADKFKLSLRTVYRDIKALDEAGVPTIGEAGIGYSIMEGYRLPPVMFTKEEATAFLTAEKLVEKLTDGSTKKNYGSAMLKVKAVLRLTEKDYLEDMEQHIEVIENQYVPKRTNDTVHLQQVLQSIAQKNVLQLDYFANHNQQHSKRDVEPVGIYYLGEYWYMVGYCRLRRDYRTFKFGSINKLTVTNEHFKQQHPSLKSFLSKKSKEKKLQTVVILIDKNILPYFGDQKYYNGFVSQKEIDDKIEMIFLSASLNGFARWYMNFGDHAEIVEPQALRDVVKEVLESIGNKMK